MATADAISSLPAGEVAAVPFAVIRAYRRTGCAVVTVERAGRTPHRHRVSLRRYGALRVWTITPITRAPRRWRTTGSWARRSIAVSLWEMEVRT